MQKDLLQKEFQFSSESHPRISCVIPEGHLRLEIEYLDEKDLEASGFDAGDRDSLFEDAAKLIVSAQVGSTSFIQRRMKLGYNRAGRLMDQLESAGIVGPSQGSKPREVLYKSDAELYDFLQNLS